MKKIGLIGGMSWESTALYYQHINREVAKRQGGLRSARVHLISLDFQEIADLGQKYAKVSDMKGMNTNRGSRHFIYLNRTFFGLYNMMHDLKAKDVAINNFKNYCK